MGTQASETQGQASAGRGWSEGWSQGPERRTTKLGARVIAAAAVLAVFPGCRLIGPGAAEAKKQFVAPSPLEIFLGFDQDAVKRRFVRLERALDRCMKARGFTYVPNKPSNKPVGLFGAKDRSDQLAYKTGFGYGIANTINELQEVRNEWPSRPPDPNQEILANLRPDRQAAYLKALNGDGARQGCAAQAATRVGPSPEAYAELEDRYWAMEYRILADPRTAALGKDWAQCMKEREYDFSNKNEIRRYLSPKMHKIVGAVETVDGSGERVVIIGTKDPHPSTASEIDDFSDVDRGALHRLSQEELLIAQADLVCMKSQQPQHDLIRAEYENQFVEENRSELEKLRASFAPHGSGAGTSSPRAKQRPTLADRRCGWELCPTRK